MFGVYKVWFCHFQIPITLLFVVRNIKCGYSFSKQNNLRPKLSRLEKKNCFATQLDLLQRCCLVLSLTSSVNKQHVKWLGNSKKCGHEKQFIETRSNWQQQTIRWNSQKGLITLNIYSMMGNKEKCEFDQEMPQLYTTDQPTAPRGRDTEQ